MLGRKKAEVICKDVLRRAGKDPAEVLLHFENQNLTRFANNYIHQNVAERNATLMVRVLRGKRMGLAAGNRLDEDGLDKLVARARANSEVSPEDPDYPGLPEPARYEAVNGFDQLTAEYSPQDRAKLVDMVCRLASEKGLNNSGLFSNGTNEVAIANTQGVMAYYAGTNADFQTVVTSEDASGREQGSGWRVGEIPVESLGRDAIQRTEDGSNPRSIDPGEYTVVLTPYGTEDLLNMLNYYGMGSQALLEGRSWMNDRLGEKVMSSLVDIWDDGLDPSGMPMPFDFEGVPRQRVDIVHKGIVKSPVYDRITARKMGETTTGHALPPTMRSLGPIATNLFMATGSSSTEEMIRSTKPVVHPRTALQ